MPRLTVAIPTYNRNDILKANLGSLLPQLSSDCELIILDNASDVPVSTSLGCMLAERAQCRAAIIRHRVNIGGNANVLRCFELCETEWLWILGDDDSVGPECVKTILEAINAYGECCFINFAGSGSLRRAPVITRTLTGFIDSLDGFSELLWISSGVYNVPRLRRFLPVGYLYGYARAPHCALVLAGLHSGLPCCLSDSAVLDWNAPVAVTLRWSHLSMALGKMTLLELPMSSGDRHRLAARISSRPRFELLVILLMLLARRQGSSDEAMFLYYQMYSRLHCCDGGIVNVLRKPLYAMIIRRFRVGCYVLERLMRLWKRGRFAKYRAIIEDQELDRFAWL